MLHILWCMRFIITHVKRVLLDYLSLLLCTIKGMSICDVDKNSNMNIILILRLYLILWLQCVIFCKINHKYNTSKWEKFLTHPKFLIQPLGLVAMPCILVKNIFIKNYRGGNLLPSSLKTSKSLQGENGPQLPQGTKLK